MEHKGMKIMAKNRQVYHDYFVEEEYEAGIELFGTEVKSIRAGTLTELADPYSYGTYKNPHVDHFIPV